jgi:hypothetical protein
LDQGSRSKNQRRLGFRPLRLRRSKRLNTHARLTLDAFALCAPGFQTVSVRVGVVMVPASGPPAVGPPHVRLADIFRMRGVCVAALAKTRFHSLPPRHLCIPANPNIARSLTFQVFPGILLAGHRASILRISSSASSRDSMNAVCRAGEGLPSIAANLRHRKIEAITPSVRFRPSSIEAF